MKTYWACFECPDRGDGDKAAEMHTRATEHGTWTTTKAALAAAKTTTTTEAAEAGIEEQS